MTRVPDFYIISKDIRMLQRRVEWLDKRIAEREANAGGAGFDRNERAALVRLLSQIEEKGVVQVKATRVQSV